MNSNICFIIEIYRRSAHSPSSEAGWRPTMRDPSVPLAGFALSRPISRNLNIMVATLLVVGVIVLPVRALCGQTQGVNRGDVTSSITQEEQRGIDEDVALHLGDVPAAPGPRAKLSSSLDPAAVRAVEHKVADWELERMQPYFKQNWQWAVLYTGFMAASETTQDERYRDAMFAMGEKFHWEPGAKLPDANQQAVAQTYLELYLTKPVPQEIQPTRAAFDDLVAGKAVDIPPDQAQITWWLCDWLYMGPPAWTRMYAATHERKYLEYLDKHWWETSNVLYDPQHHLYFRDITFLHQKNALGKPVFWSRGNGWVMGALVRVLDYMPKDDPTRARYETQLREMSAELASIQDKKSGLWHSDLLDPADYPQPEISGSAFVTFGIAWGVNHGVLDRATYTPVIARAWRGLVGQIYADGRLGNIQQTGDAPAHYLVSSSYNYGVGAFLLAGAQVAELEAHAGKKVYEHKPTQ
jgi:unsaturated rhamnogalacturonyl hydrolase